MIIGVAGKKRSGKDTFYEIVKNELENVVNVKKYAFADLVKLYAIKYFGIPESQIKLERHRFILQGIGQMFREEINSSFWIDAVFQEIDLKKHNESKELSIITDVRYFNEAEAILSKEDSILVKIVNPRTNLHKDFHQSENDLNDYHFDFLIDNSGDLEDYQKEVKGWISKNYSLIIPW